MHSHKAENDIKISIRGDQKPGSLETRFTWKNFLLHLMSFMPFNYLKSTDVSSIYITSSNQAHSG